jgi:hypothetical protein
MTTTSFARRATLAASALLTALAIAPFAVSSAQSAVAKLGPRASTGGVAHVRGTSAVLHGNVNPNGSDTTYFFQYGPTVAYGRQTPVTPVGKGTTSVKVGQTVLNFVAGSHYRIVATNAKGTTFGRDRTYSAASLRLKFAMERTKGGPTPYGGTFVLRGTLTPGPLHAVTAQSSPFPYLTPFSDVGSSLLTNAAGAFAIPIANLKQSTQLRVRTDDPRPLLSAIVDARVAVRVTLKVRSSARKGLVRLYGTVTPAKVGATVLLQVEKAVRPRAKSEAESESRFATQERTIVKRATKTFSRFSKVVTIRKTGHYRAYVVLHSGSLVSGASPSVTLHAAAK